MTERTELELTQEDYEAAISELSFLLDILVRTIGDLVGAGGAGVGRMAGQHMARKLPIYLVEPTLDDVLEALKQQMKGGFELSFSSDDSDDARVNFGRCAIREVCARRNQNPGGEVCKLFHHYFSGMVGELLGVRVRGSILSAHESCVTQMEVL